MTAPYYSDDQVALYHGDALDVLRGMGDCTVDAVVTDPPAGVSFMNRGWDHHKGGRDQWIKWLAEIMAEALRVTKPGGHAFVWALPRTSHWTATAIEDAGWEIRDRVVHLFGSGFPKSLDVSKAIDRAAGELDPEGVRFTTAGRTEKNLPNPPTRGYVPPAPATDDARTWQGWGTALKPAAEDWWLARKPLGGRTVAANVLRYGTGALNVDATRVGTSGGGGNGLGSHFDRLGNTTPLVKHGDDRGDSTGRWPPNVVLDDHAAAELDRQSGTLPGRVGMTKHGSGTNGVYGKYARTDQSLVNDGTPDSGGASRFFPVFKYAAKAPTSERPRVAQDGAGEARVLGNGTEKCKQCRVCGNKTIGGTPGPMPNCGHDDYEYVEVARRNDHTAHPTVKPLDLMRWLVRLVTPPGGTILDCFAGSGTTGEAAILEHFHAILIEREADYLPLIVARLTKPIAVGFDFEPAPVARPTTEDTRAGEATAEKRYTSEGGTNFAMKPGPRYDRPREVVEEPAVGFDFEDAP